MSTLSTLPWAIRSSYSLGRKFPDLICLTNAFTVSVDVSLTLKEYVEDIDQAKDETQEQQTPMSGSSEYMGGDILGGGVAIDHTTAH